MSGKAVLDALIVLNESALLIEEIGLMVAKLRNGEEITEEELDESYSGNRDSLSASIEKYTRAPD